MSRIWWIMLSLVLGCGSPTEPEPLVVCVDYWDATTGQVVPGPCEVAP